MSQVTPNKEHLRLWVERPGHNSLMNLNDSGKSFSEIAATIESEPPRLFQ